MKKRIFILFLCALVLLSPLCLSSAATSVNYISINDSLPPELVNTFTYYAGTVYVPCSIFSTYGLGVSYSYIADLNTAYLYSGSQQLFFEIDSGQTYDGNDNLYSLSGIIRNGVVYVPISYISVFFGSFSYSTISTQYGTVLRIKDGRAVLSDTDFIQAATPQLKQYYNAHQVVPTPTPTPSPTPEPEIDHEGTELMLSFVGLPGENYFETLDFYNFKACFFLSAEDVLASPDTVRRIVGEGHRVGVLCGENALADYEETASLIFEAARVRSILVSAPAEYAETCIAMAQEQSLAYCRRGMDAVYLPEDNISPYVVTSELNNSEQGSSLFLSCGEGMEDFARIVIMYLRQNKYSVFPPLEIRPSI